MGSWGWREMDGKAGWRVMAWYMAQQVLLGWLTLGPDTGKEGGQADRPQPNPLLWGLTQRHPRGQSKLAILVLLTAVAGFLGPTASGHVFT